MGLKHRNLPIFVYGTLKRGECRADCWPRRPRSIEEAAVLGRLYDLGEYPALVEGDMTVRGELWSFAADDLPETLRVLDAIEGYGGADDDLYHRRVVDCRFDDGRTQPAYCYFFARPQDLVRYPLVAPDADGYCRWRAR